MSKLSKTERQSSLIERLKARLLLAVGLLILSLFLIFAVSTVTYNNQRAINNQIVSIQDDTNGLLRSMLDQETSLRGYISTDNPTFLQPFTAGRPQYLAYLQHLKAQTSNSNFVQTSIALAQVDARAEDWYNNYAQVQIKKIQNGDTTTPRLESMSTLGKNLFDRFRSSITQLQQTSDHDLAKLQSQGNTANRIIVVGIIVITILAIILLIRTFTTFSNNLRQQLNTLSNVTNQLGSGNLAARVQPLDHYELHQLGQNFNHMAQALQQQQNILRERDILDNILQLNTTLSTSLDLDSLTDSFLKKALPLLDLQFGALYLYSPENNRLNLATAQGLNSHDVQTTFALGEGTVGHVALTREVLHLKQPSGDISDDFTIKTTFGFVLPTSLYHLPLSQGKILLGVLVIGAMAPLSEKARNVLNVVSIKLSAAISNTQAYQRIQAQAEELERRGAEQERTNAELSHQRDELTVLNTALEEANRVRSQFLATMSHELRTPLTAIIGFSQILLRGSELSTLTQRQKNSIQRILNNGQHLLALINDVLDMAKIEAGQMDVSYREINVKELLSSVVEETQSLATQRKLTLTYAVEEGIDQFETDPTKLRQILFNLVSNALKFTPQGSVTITATSALDAEYIVIAVKDTGIGIAPEIQERIFDAFYQADSSDTRQYGGTGLGLSIVRQLTHLLGGKLEVQSTSGQGSTFTLTLPRHKRTTQPEAESLRLYSIPASSPTLGPSSGELVALPTSNGTEDPKRSLILAVDDNPDILSLITSALENSQYKVVCVHDPSKVISLAQKLRPHAVTLDVMMPGTNGWQLLHQLKTNPVTANIPVIMLTVVADSSTGKVLGADKYLVKPIERDVLLRTLDELNPDHDSSTQAS